MSGRPGQGGGQGDRDRAAVEKYALRSNLAIPGMKRVESFGHRAWKEGAAAVLPVLKLLFSMSEDEAAPRVVAAKRKTNGAPFKVHHNGNGDSKVVNPEKVVPLDDEELANF